MKTNLDLKQIIHPSYFLQPEERKMVEEYYDYRKREMRRSLHKSKTLCRSGQSSIKNHVKKILLSAFALVFAAITVPFLFVTSEAKTDFDPLKVEKMQKILPELQLKYDEVSKDLSGLTGVVSYLLESEKQRALEARVEVKPKSILYEPESMPFKVATIAKDKTPLKLEKSLGSKTIIFVGKDSKLAIKGEEGDWLLVASPKGGNAWIQKDFLK